MDKLTQLENRIKVLEDLLSGSSAFNSKVYNAMVNELSLSKGIGIGNALINGDSVLFSVSSTSKGVRFPRMTTTQRNAIVNPKAGDLIFNTSTGVYNFHNGTSWGAI